MLLDDPTVPTSYGAEGYWGFMGHEAGYPEVVEPGGFDWAAFREGVVATGEQQAYDPLHAEDMIPGMVFSVFNAIDLPTVSYGGGPDFSNVVGGASSSFDFGGLSGGSGSSGGGTVTVGPIEVIDVETEAE